MSKTIANIRDRMSEFLSDYQHATVTTALTSNVNIVDTALANVKGGMTEDYFKDWWALIISYANSGASRLVTNYDQNTKTMTVQGNSFASDAANLATYELHRYEPALKLRAINAACRSTYPVLARPVKNRTLITGNWLPNAHFEDWASTSVPDIWASGSAGSVFAASTSVTRGGAKSVKVTAGPVASGQLTMSYANFPRLLDLAGQTVSFYCWAYPEVANDAVINIATLKADGTVQSLTSTTSCPAGYWTLLRLEDQAINSDIIQITINLNVTTATKYAYFDDARLVTGSTIHELVLPTDFRKGHLKQVNIQATSYTGNSETLKACDDIGENNRYLPVYNWSVISDGTYSYLTLPEQLKEYRIELLGITPLENDADADTDTVTIDDPQVDALAYKACSELYQMLSEPASMTSKAEYDREIARFEGKYQMVTRQRPQLKPAGRVRFV